MASNERLTQYDSLEALLSALEERHDPTIDLPGSMRRHLERKARERGVPLHGTFELTPLCNLNCRMCYAHLTKEQLQGRALLTVRQWKALMDAAIDLGMLDATFTGGECLTYPGVEELYLHLYSKGVRTTILTNGLLMTPERVDFFKRYPPRGVQITLYGSDEAEYEAVTGARCFERVVQNIRELAQTEIPLSVAITPNRFLSDGGERLVRLAHSLGVHYTINTSLFRPREETGRREDRIDLPDDAYIALHRLRRSLHGVETQPNTCDLPLPSKRGSEQRGLLCSAGNSGFHVRWDGKMLPCGSFEGVEAEPLKEGFPAAWEKIHAACAEYPLPEECAECAYRGLCPACVMVHRQGAAPGHASPEVCARAQKLAASGLAEWNKEG